MLQETLQLPQEISGGFDWLPTATLRPRRTASPYKLEVVDIRSQLESFLSDPRSNGALRALDVLNGCGWMPSFLSDSPKTNEPCHTCLVDAPLITSLIPLAAWKELRSDKRFLEKIQKKSLRVGIQSNPLNHPEWTEIAKDMVENVGIKGRQIKFWVNFREGYREKIGEMLNMAKFFGERMTLHISLPVNHTPGVNRDFENFSKEYLDVFGHSKRGPDGLVDFHRTNLMLPNVWVADVFHGEFYFSMGGRGLVKEELKGSGALHNQMVYDGNGIEAWRKAFLGNLFMNPEGLWWRMILPTSMSYNGQGMLHLDTREKLEFAMKLPQHPDFNYPDTRGTNKWPGGFGKLASTKEARELREKFGGKVLSAKIGFAGGK